LDFNNRELKIENESDTKIHDFRQSFYKPNC